LGFGIKLGYDQIEKQRIRARVLLATTESSRVRAAGRGVRL
jgi:hypothetical protein